MLDLIAILSEELQIPADRLEKTIALIDEGNTIPFIARYRKEVTGSLDDTILRKLDDRLKYLRNLEARKQEVRTAIEGQGKLTPEILTALEMAKILTEVEDIYRPFKQKRKTRASVAREKGLEPLAKLLLAQKNSYEAPLETIAESYLDEEKGVTTVQEAFDGACDILAEDISDNADYRKALRTLTFQHGILISKQAKEESSVYDKYYDYKEAVRTIPQHRVLALNRGEAEDFLKITLEIDTAIPLNYLYGQIIAKQNSPARVYVVRAMTDSYDRLISPSIEREIRTQLTDDAGEGAIKLFSENLRHLLMQAPVHGKTVLGLDPGFRTGCKLAVVDKTGKVLDTAVIFMTIPNDSRAPKAKEIVCHLVNQYKVDLIAIGNGTASRESEAFIAALIKERALPVQYAIVSEAGASVYSASELGADEFPDFDVTQRSAVSIARRLQDPLAELVKIDPKAIGVGQYQHDMKQNRLDEALTGVVEDCVNSVGVDVNTASHSLLSYIAGINMTSAKNIVRYREENGEFTSRAQILKVPRIGAKAYEQCAGFLRVSGSDEILDHTGVHPESYAAAHQLLAHFSYTEDDVRQNHLQTLRKQAESAGLSKLAAELGIGVPTLNDMIAELEKPGRDVRDTLPPPALRDDVMSMEDLKEGMELTGTVRNVIDFGAFVDIGVHQDGLVHISQISDRYIKHPSEVLAVGDIVKVKVLSVDLAKKRIALTMKGL